MTKFLDSGNLIMFNFCENRLDAPFENFFRFQTPGRENVINPSNFSPLLRIDPHLLAQINSYNAQCNTDVGSVEKETWASEVFLQVNEQT